MVCPYLEFHAAIKGKKLLIYTLTWIDLKEILLSKKINTQRLNTIWFHLYKLLKLHHYKHKDSISGFQDLGLGKEGACGL